MIEEQRCSTRNDKCAFEISYAQLPRDVKPTQLMIFHGKISGDAEGKSNIPSERETEKYSQEARAYENADTARRRWLLDFPSALFEIRVRILFPQRSCSKKKNKQFQCQAWSLYHKYHKFRKFVYLINRIHDSFSSLP
jgi:hypothetical protein